MSVLRTIRAAVAAVLTFAAAAASAGTLDGEDFQLDYLFPDSATLYGQTDGPVFGTVGPGIDATIDVEGVTQIALDFSGLKLDIAMTSSLVNPVWSTAPFNGLRVTFLSLASPFVSFSEVAASFGPISPSFTDDELFVNWNGAGYEDGSTASFAVGLAPVPLPASVLMLLAGVGGIGALRLRGRAWRA